ncbi:MAG: ATP-binding protein [Ilumatobacteraceae bacterium]
MKIRDRLSLQFTLVSAALLFVVLAAIYVLSWHNRQQDFYGHLLDRAITNAEIFLAEDNLSAEKFRDVQKKYPLSLPDEIIRIYNDEDNAMFIKDSTFHYTRTDIDHVRKERYIEYSRDDRQTVGIYYIDNSGNYVILASAIDKEGFEKQRQLLWIMVVSFLISAGILFFAGRVFARIALSPIKKVIKDVRIIRSSSLNKRLDIKDSKDEINELAITFNNLLEHLEQSFEAQSSFVAHASHELRTPITSIVGDVEVTLSQQRTNEEYQKTLQGVLTETEKLNDLINNLFELAQTNIDITEFRDLQLDELAWQLKDEWSNRLPDSQIDIQYHLPEDVRKFTIQGNHYLLFIGISNILKNAIKFSNNRTVFLQVYLQNNTPVISIRDTGIGIAKEDQQKIFQPFFRGANTFGYTGYGVGLSLADKILRLHNVRVVIISEPGQGSEFQLLFTN